MRQLCIWLATEMGCRNWCRRCHRYLASFLWVCMYTMSEWNGTHIDSIDCQHIGQRNIFFKKEKKYIWQRMFSTLFRVELLSMDTFHGNGIYENPASYSVTPCQCLTCPSSISNNQRRASNAIYIYYIFMYNRYTSFRSARRIKSARGTKQIVLFRVSFVICVALIYIFPFFSLSSLP